MNQKKITVYMGDAANKEYIDFSKILNVHGIKTAMVQSAGDGNEMGVGFEELVILLPLLTPVIVEFRKALEAYFAYKKPMNKKKSITLQNGNKKMIIEGENCDIPDVKTLKEFLEDK